MTPRPGYRALARLDAWVNRVFGARWNPLYHSGAITVVMLAVLLATGLYLMLFYRIAEPYDSVVRIHGQVWGGRWIRGVHRFASDVAVVAAVVHGVRMFVQRRTWGPRALAWISGVVLTAVLLVSGWTGYVLVWDTHAQLLAVQGARVLDALPVFSEPIGRAFVGEQAVPGAFFFLTLFAHIALPIGLGALLWVHVARVARPVLLPARRVLWTLLVVLPLLALLWPAPLAPEADLLRVPADVPLDWFYTFWLPLAERVPAWSVWLLGAFAIALLLVVPRLTRPRTEALPAPARVNERTCTGCEQCVADCPYEAIAMVPRADGREGMVARVNEALCTSCGICIGSCPPMAIGAQGITGRDQVAAVREFVAREQPGPDDVVIVGCMWSAAAAEAERCGARCMPVSCVGAMHSSTVELLLRGGAGGVLVVGCAEHDGRTREGVTWTNERLFEGRLAGLKERVEKRRVRLVQASLGERVVLHAAARAFAAEIEALADAEEKAADIVEMCRALQPVASREPGAGEQ